MLLNTLQVAFEITSLLGWINERTEYEYNVKWTTSFLLNDIKQSISKFQPTIKWPNSTLIRAAIICKDLGNMAPYL